MDATDILSFSKIKRRDDDVTISRKSRLWSKNHDCSS